MELYDHQRIRRRLRAVEIAIQERDDILRASDERIRRLLEQVSDACDALGTIVAASEVIGTPPANTEHAGKKSIGRR